MGTRGWKGKSVVCVPDSSIPEDISKAAVVLHIGAISFRGEGEEEEAAQQLRLKRDHGYGCGYYEYSYGYNPPYFRQQLRQERTVELSSVYSVSVGLESSPVNGPSASETTKEIRTPMRRNNKPQEPIFWNYCGMRFDIDLHKIHESVVKIEVNRFYLTEFRIKNWILNQQRRGKTRWDQKPWNDPFDKDEDRWEQFDDDDDDDDDDSTPPNIIEPSEGITVIGRARIPLWGFLRGEKNRKIGSASPLSDLLSGDENRVASFGLAKMDGSGTKEEGALQVLFNINKYMPKKQQQAQKKLDSFSYYLDLE